MIEQVASSLIGDAHLVLAYAVRVGRLPSDALPVALRDAEAKLASGETPSLVALSQAINTAVNAIAPVTLIDLRAGRSPFDPQSQRTTRLLQYALCALTIVLAILVAYYSYAVHRQEGALREYAEIQAARIPEKTSELRKLVTRDRVLQSKDSRYEQFLRSSREIKDLEARRVANFVLLQRLAEEPLWPFAGDLRALGEAIYALGAPPPPGLEVASAADGALSDLPYSPDEDRCDEKVLVGAPERMPRGLVVSWTVDVDRERTVDYCFARKMFLGDGEANYQPMADLAGEIRNGMLLRNTWILPFLTGVLGAAIFLLRDSLSPYTATLGTARMVVRLAMGGVAGIIIGWFWIPSGLGTTDLAKGSALPLALAFVTGYSIDILFSALERVRGFATAPPESAKAK